MSRHAMHARALQSKQTRATYLALPRGCHAQDFADQLQTFPVNLLAALAQGRVDLLLEVKRELASRGLNTDAEWVGFAEAEALLGSELTPGAK